MSTKKLFIFLDVSTKKLFIFLDVSTKKLFCIMKGHMLFSRHALAITWLGSSLLKCTVQSGLVSFFLCYSSGDLTRKPYGSFCCPGNKINAVPM